jgi:hypothetical protein
MNRDIPPPGIPNLRRQPDPNVASKSSYGRSEAVEKPLSRSDKKGGYDKPTWQRRAPDSEKDIPVGGVEAIQTV